MTGNANSPAREKSGQMFTLGTFFHDTLSNQVIPALLISVTLAQPQDYGDF
jgi:hypothetical protein